MTLKLMYITRRPEIAAIVQQAGVDRIFVDMEYIGKSLRQEGLDSVNNHHTIEDIKNVRKVIDKSELLVRVNPIHKATDEYCSSEEEIEGVVNAGADIIMLPYFKTVEEASAFISMVGGRCKTMLLVETPEAAEHIDEILEIPGIDEVHIGMNDLSLGYHKKFLFELLCDGTVENLCRKFKAKGIPYGFGGIAALDKGLLPAEYIIKEHYRLGSTLAILSRSFLNTEKVTDLDYINDYFNREIKKIRDYEEAVKDCNDFEENSQKIRDIVETILERMK